MCDGYVMGPFFFAPVEEGLDKRAKKGEIFVDLKERTKAWKYLAVLANVASLEKLPATAAYSENEWLILLFSSSTLYKKCQEKAELIAEPLKDLWALD